MTPHSLDAVRTIVLVLAFLLLVAFFGPPLAANTALPPNRTCEYTPLGSDTPISVRRSFITGVAQWRVPDQLRYTERERWLNSGAITETRVGPTWRGGYAGFGDNTTFNARGFNPGPYDVHAIRIYVDHDDESRAHYELTPSSDLLAIPRELLGVAEDFLGASISPRIQANTYGTLSSGPVHPDSRDLTSDDNWSWTTTSTLISLHIPNHICR